MSQEAQEIHARERLQELLAAAGLRPLREAALARFEAYLSLFLRWNTRTNLSAVRDAEGILQRHFVESIACAQFLPVNVGNLLDFGSGGGFPGIPIAICRPEIAVTLAESQGKKTAFLREVVRTLEIPAQVHGDRAERLQHRFDCVILRAVDRMERAVAAAAGLMTEAGCLVLMTTRREAQVLQAAAGPEFIWDNPLPLPGSTDRVIVIGRHGSR